MNQTGPFNVVVPLTGVATELLEVLHPTLVGPDALAATLRDNGTGDGGGDAGDAGGASGGSGSGGGTPEIASVHIALGDNHVFDEPRHGLASSFEVRVTTANLPINLVSLQLTSDVVGSDGDVFDLQPNSPAGTSRTWTVAARFRRSGDRQLTATAKAVDAVGDPIDSSDDRKTVNVAPTNRQPLLGVTVGGSDATQKPALNLPLGGASFGVDVFPSLNALETTSRVGIAVQIDGVVRPEIALTRIERSDGLTQWSNNTAVTLTEDLAPRPFPMRGKPQPVLLVREYDFFQTPPVETAFNFDIADVTAPIINITSPKEDEVFTVQSLPLTVNFSGSVRDSQSGYKTGSLVYFISGQAEQHVDVAADGSWGFSVQVAEYSKYTVTMKAADNDTRDGVNPGNPRTELRQFDVRSSFKPQSIEELLSRRAYLQELLRFADSNITAPSAQGPSLISPELLRKEFFQAFGSLSQQNWPGADEVVNELLTPIRLIRQNGTPESAGLLARYSFEEGHEGTGDLLDRGSRFALNGRYVGATSPLVDPQHRGAISIDQDHYAIVDVNTSKLEVGKDDSDFSVSFWIYLQGRGPDSWPAILYKGNPEDAGGELNRTFALWLAQDSNRVHFRIATMSDGGGFDGNDGGNSNTPLPFNRWTHLAYVKVGPLLQLYIDGALDAEIRLKGKVISNSRPLNIGRGSYASNSGFVGALDELRIYAVALDAEDVRQLAIDRHAGLTETPIVDYHRAAYEALLAGLGTSFEEVRSINLLTAPQREAMAKRLGLWIGVESDVDRLDSLLAIGVDPEDQSTPGTPGSVTYERWLYRAFGLPPTINFERPVNSPPPPPPRVLSMRLDALVRQWNREDGGYLELDLDPDLVDVADIAPKASDWVNELRSRSSALAAQYSVFANAVSARDAINAVYGADEQANLLLLEARDANGGDITKDLLPLQLDRAMFRRLIAYLKLANGQTQFSSHEREDLSHLLVQVWKKRKLAQGWRDKERAIAPQKLWPNYSSGTLSDPAWQPDNFKSTYLPWRGSAQDRARLVARIAGRLRAWQDLVDAQVQAVSDAQRVALPLLRDGLLGLSDLPDSGKRMGGLAERWLMDFAPTGASQLTPIEQATSSLQTLVNGVRGGWFGSRHPAAEWKPFDDQFNAQWSWIESYGRWQAAVLNFLYPENILFPELKETDTTPNSPALNVLLAVLGKLQPFSKGALTSEELVAARANVPKSDDSTDYYFAQVAIALALQRAGLFVAALDEYREVYDTSKSRPEDRKRVPPLKGERDDLPPLADFGDAKWTTTLTDPHSVAAAGKSGCRNPYTRFTLYQILRCLLGQADDAFASGTRDGRARALALFLEANDVLSFEELRDLQPSNPLEAFLPSPTLAALRAHVASALSKLRRGLSYLGTPLPPDLTSGKGGGVLSSLVRPTPYRYRVLMDRAKQLTSQAQQLEAQYLSAIEHGDSEAEKYLQGGFALETAQQTVDLRTLQRTEAADGKLLAQDQQQRSQAQGDRYREWIAAGPSESEKSQIDNLWAAKTARDVIAGYDAALQTASAFQSALSVDKLVTGSLVAASIVGGLAVHRAVAQGFLDGNETRAQVSAINASQERRVQEWQLQSELANHDVKIGAQQVTLAQDRIAVANQESLISESQRDHAQQTLAFLGLKFTSARFYQWMVGELAQAYSTFLRLATVTAHHAELQLAFERQEQPARLIKADYWVAAFNAAASASNTTQQGSSSSSLDPRGITGSVRLLQDLYTLDERAFSSERRLLNLSQSFSMARLAPVEFEEFRRTGMLAFSTPIQWFDEGFPGHYMRLIKKVRLAVAALIPPTIGIRATLANSGLSRVVTADAGYPTMVIRQDPQMVALTSPMASSGVFELDTQAELLYPFEGTGVDTTWYLELPPAGNPFEYDALIDVVLSIEYTAQFSPELRDRVVKKLPRNSSGYRTFSVKRDFPDAWYEISNSDGDSINIAIPISRRSFPPGLTELRVAEVAVSSRSVDGKPCEFQAALEITLADKSQRKSSPATSISGIASSRRAGGAGWHRRVDGGGQAVDVIDNMPALTDAEVLWTLMVSNQADSSSDAPPLILQQLRDGKVDDILVVMTFSGAPPAWG